MPLAVSDLRAETPLIERRALRWLLLFYCLFILYGSFIPFRFSADAAFVYSQWGRFFAPPFVNGVRQFSILDVVSNVLLFIPFGFVWVGSEIGRPILSRLFGVTLVVSGVGFLFGMLIEVGQMFSPGRTASILDAVCNGFGAGIGGTFGYVIFRALRGYLGPAVTAILRERPLLLVLLLLMMAVLADAYYPFEITLDVSTVWDNLKHIQWVPFVGGPHRFWMYLVVEKVFFFAAISYLAIVDLRRYRLRSPAPLAWCLCIAFAFAVETGKLFFVGRVPNAENFVLAGFGALIGIVLVVPAAETACLRRNSSFVLLVLILAVQVYSELSPFDWISSANELPARIAKIEWLPFSAYYGADPQSALFDLGKKFFIVGPLGFILASRKRRGRLLAALVGLISGVILEACQVALRSRTASITDVLVFGVAAWLGAVVYERFLRIREVDNSCTVSGHEANAQPGGRKTPA